MKIKETVLLFKRFVYLIKNGKKEPKRESHEGSLERYITHLRKVQKGYDWMAHNSPSKKLQREYQGRVDYLSHIINKLTIKNGLVAHGH